jgi:cell division transport system ATP-binding protein
MAVLSINGLKMTYPNGNEAIRDMSFDVERGEFVFLSGPSGSGKTTLIRILLKMEESTGGEVLVFGRNLRALKQSAIPYLRRNIGVIFQDFRLLQDRTVFENMALGLNILGMSEKEIARRVEGILYDLGIDRYAGAYPAMLSGGEQQRVAIGRALVMEPALILADEPTGNLDWELSQEIVKLFEELNARGTSVLMATHDRFLLDAFPKRTLLINRGILVEDRRPDARQARREAEAGRFEHFMAGRTGIRKDSGSGANPGTDGGF